MGKGLEQCDKCDYFISVEEAYQQGRADVIEEIIKKIKSRKAYFEEFYPNDSIAIAEANAYLEIAEKLKEKKK